MRERPEWIEPQFVFKAIRYPGNKIHATDYVDTEDFAGPLQKVFDDALAFVMRNLHKVQAGRGVNAPGLREISESVFEELLVNALVHRDYMVSAPIWGIGSDQANRLKYCDDPERSASKRSHAMKTIDDNYLTLK